MLVDLYTTNKSAPTAPSNYSTPIKAYADLLAVAMDEKAAQDGAKSSYDNYKDVLLVAKTKEKTDQAILTAAAKGKSDTAAQNVIAFNAYKGIFATDVKRAKAD